ncbi:methyl-accepting chemotaxis protein, partial [Elioraea tepidiphila]|uniref:methyl-accepting chemotaxis protein n=1 Tax=Elioraea tepidiphila TaxID=457934 RepID=UPI002FD923D2
MTLPTAAESSALEALRAAAARFLLGLLWLHLPVAGLAAWAFGSGPWLAMAIMALFAGVATVLWRSDPTGLGTRLAIAVGVVGAPAMLVAEAAGHPWQIDLHMYFFAALAILAAFADWRVILAGAGVTALHHLTLNVVAPALVFPEGADLGRVVLHAVIVIAETVTLCWLALRVEQALPAAERAAEEARAAGAEVRRLAEEAERTRAAAAEAKRAVATSLAERVERDVGGIASAVEAASGETGETAEAIATGAAAMRADAAAVAAAAQGASADLQVAAAAAEEMTASIAEITRRLSAAAAMATRAAEEAASADTTVADLGRATRRIEDVTSVIGDVAARTNLLALNATIEAARAG